VKWWRMCVCVHLCVCSIIAVNVVGCSVGRAVTTGLKQLTASTSICRLLLELNFIRFYSTFN